MQTAIRKVFLLKIFVGKMIFSSVLKNISQHSMYFYTTLYILN